MNNLFITFEGGDGSGKSTQVNLLKDYLDNLNFETIKTREPGGTPSAEILRDLLTTGEVERWNPMSEALLMWASRYEHLTQVIEPALNSGKNVICDRFYDSTYAYQGVAHNLGIDKMEELKKIIIGDIEPDVTFILDIDPKVGLKRSLDRSNKENRFESYNIDFHNKIRSGFLEIAKKNKERCVVVDASLNEQEINNLIITVINNLIVDK
ncbi:MAG: dTMP kinase [Rhodobiaceae bacterium]|nr:dTMP kinase [Rhodobiaceae bacterium]|tara:strand:+ start:1954 stop:2583 length:630 start_codon:yes stop_codon:yes gene_type:complete